MATIVPFYAPAQPVLPLPALALCHHLLRASGTVMMIKDRGSAMLFPHHAAGRSPLFLPPHLIMLMICLAPHSAVLVVAHARAQHVSVDVCKAHGSK